MNGMHPSTFPDLYKSIILGDMQSPGEVTLSGHNRDEAWDIQAAKGQTGATTILNGKAVGSFQASFYLAGDHDDENGDNDFLRWDLFQRLIESTTNGSTPKALPIYHPDLCRNGFTEVVNGGVGGMVWDGRGGATVVVKFLEYRPAKPKAAKAASAKPSTSATKPVRPDPNADAKRELAGLVARAKQP